MTHMYGIAITYGVVSLFLLGGFAYLTYRITKKWLNKENKESNLEEKEDDEEIKDDYDIDWKV